MMKIRKVVFPVGGMGTRFYPITRAVPKEMLGVFNKPLIHYAFEEALNAGIEHFIFVTRQGKNAIEDYFDYMVVNSSDFNTSRCCFCYVRQSEPRGLGDAVLCARSLVNNEPFAVISADDFISSAGKSCIGDMINSYSGQNMAAVMQVPKADVEKYGILESDNYGDKIVVAKSVCEKPPVNEAKSNLGIVGRYVLSPQIFDVLASLTPGKNGEIQLTDALMRMIPTIGLVGFKFDGKRFDCGSKEGLLAAILHVASSDDALKRVLRNFECGDKS